MEPNKKHNIVKNIFKILTGVSVLTVFLVLYFRTTSGVGCSKTLEAVWVVVFLLIAAINTYLRNSWLIYGLIPVLLLILNFIGYKTCGLSF